ncbi:MAG: T9SS type A sorting domain-containing protein [Candidatus Kapabacteria bacterium]|nr:T9SS type A sorting domain-containing protein [Candidatus Kapabacteria bacterium]
MNSEFQISDVFNFEQFFLPFNRFRTGFVVLFSMSWNTLYFLFLPALILAFQPLVIKANLINATPANYSSLVPNLKPGDTLLFVAGTYMNHLNVYNIAGTAAAPIVLTGPETGAPAIILGTSSGSNLVSLKMCSYITIRKLNIDCKKLMIDGLKAEGSPADNVTHDITIEDCVFDNVGDGSDQQIVAISTKCKYLWNWIIRRNVINSAGTGMYLGNSDGSNGMVSFLIEYNYVHHSIGYNLQIKQENDGLRVAAGMPKNGSHIIRYNVFSKANNSICDPALKRPNVLLGESPLTTDGKDDWFEIYGNLFYQNPCEALIQATGNLCFHHNILINDTTGYGAVIQTHNGRRPKNIFVFNNSIFVKNSAGISLSNPDTSFKQIATQNAIFSSVQSVQGFKIHLNNFPNNYTQTWIFVNKYTPFNLLQTDVYPQDNGLRMPDVHASEFEQHPDWNKDFNGQKDNFTFTGAYCGMGKNPCWQLAESKRSPVDSCHTKSFVDEVEGSGFEDCVIYPNPSKDNIIIGIKDFEVKRYNISIINYLGEIVQIGIGEILWNNQISLNLNNLINGEYLLKIEIENSSGKRIFVRRISIIR